MIKKAALIICILMAALHLGACQLAKEDGISAGENDRMVGVFVTQEYLDLFDFESYFNDNAASLMKGGDVMIGDADSEKYGGRIYATLKHGTVTSESGEVFDTQDYVFEGVEGVPFFLATMGAENGEGYISTSTSEALHDIHVTHGDNTILEGTIYVTPKDKNSIIGMYVNPVYQSADGRVYLTSGTGISFSGDMGEGQEASQTITTTEKTTDENGNIVELSFEAKIKMAVKYPTTSVAILEMGKGNEVLSSIEYSVVDLPADYSARRDTEFIILEERTKNSEGENIKRRIFEKDSSSFTVITAGEGGLCEGRYVELLWEG